MGTRHAGRSLLRVFSGDRRKGGRPVAISNKVSRMRVACVLPTRVRRRSPQAGPFDGCSRPHPEDDRL